MRRFPALWLTLVLSPMVGFAQEHAPLNALENGDARPYARYCAEIIGAPLPSFDCMADGKEIPITVHGRPVTEGEVDRCDRPSLNGQGCRRGARLGRLRFEDPDISAIFICRPSDNWTDRRPLYNRIAVIQHNRRHGATCWYETRPPEDSGGSKGTPPPDLTSKILSPVNSKHPNRSAKGTTIFPSRLSRQEKHVWSSANKNTCQTCHAPDPYLVTPFVAQVREGAERMIPTLHDPAAALTAPMWSPVFPTRDSVGLPPRVRFHKGAAGKICTECHAIGGLVTDETIAASLASRLNIFEQAQPVFLLDEQIKSALHPKRAWMHGKSRAPFELATPSQATLRAAEQAARCIKKPIPGMCDHLPVPGKPPVEMTIVSPEGPVLVSGAETALIADFNFHDPGDRVHWSYRIDNGQTNRLSRRTKSGDPATLVPPCTSGQTVQITASLMRFSGAPRSDRVEDTRSYPCATPTLIQWEPARRLLRALPVMSQGGTLAATTGGSASVISDRLFLGDDRANRKYRAYLRFPIRPIGSGPITNRVHKAELTLSLTPIGGQVAANLGDLTAIHYAYGADLTAADYNDPSQFRRGLSRFDGAPGAKTLDVTEALQAAISAGATHLELMLNTTLASDGDGQQDALEISLKPRDDGQGGIDFNTTQVPVLTAIFR